ncbi:MAG: bifunctional methylenetetrahydrofolate dehydrogenase/methenyltetrahydrofolate cyclohydrolase FolD [Pseudomonadota bacterium]
MPQATLIDGKAVAAGLRVRIKDDVAAFQAMHGRAPSLRVVLVGDDPASRSYVRSKDRMASEVGIDGALIELPETITEAELLDQVEALNRDPAVNGILVQLPLPAQIDAGRVIEAIDVAKDVDGFHPINVGRLFSARGALDPSLLVPCTPRGCLILLQETLGGGSLAGRRVVVVGRSNIVGKPVAALLLGEDCTVTLAHSKTEDLPGECRRADILVAAVGRPEMIRGNWIKPGATVIDVGVNRIERSGERRLVGDVAFAEAVEVASAITQVPGGVGPMTVTCLLRNTVIAAHNQQS